MHGEDCVVPVVWKIIDRLNHLIENMNSAATKVTKKQKLWNPDGHLMGFHGGSAAKFHPRCRPDLACLIGERIITKDKKGKTHTAAATIDHSYVVGDVKRGHKFYYDLLLQYGTNAPPDPYKLYWWEFSMPILKQLANYALKNDVGFAVVFTEYGATVMRVSRNTAQTATSPASSTVLPASSEARTRPPVNYRNSVSSQMSLAESMNSVSMETSSYKPSRGSFASSGYNDPPQFEAHTVEMAHFRWDAKEGMTGTAAVFFLLCMATETCNFNARTKYDPMMTVWKGYQMEKSVTCQH